MPAGEYRFSGRIASGNSNPIQHGGTKKCNEIQQGTNNENNSVNYNVNYNVNCNVNCNVNYNVNYSVNYSVNYTTTTSRPP